MKKISTLYKKNPDDLSKIINEINPENSWVLEGEAIATRKFDGTSTAIINGELYKRYDCKIDKKTRQYKRPIPEGAIPCQAADPKSGHHPHWVKCDRNNPSDKWHFKAFDILDDKVDGTYELCGKKVQGNPENIDGHQLIKHGSVVLEISDLSFEGLYQYLQKEDIEGIVFHHKEDDRMCKIRKTDYGIKR